MVGRGKAGGRTETREKRMGGREMAQELLSEDSTGGCPWDAQRGGGKGDTRGEIG